jgi:hypothetical protein
MDRQAERLQSLKIGLTGAIAAGGVWGLCKVGVGLYTQIAVGIWPEFTPAQLFALGVGGLAVSSSGFLFGVTYRYATRSDSNPQIQIGTVLAFSLVRSFALLESRLDPLSLTWPIPLPVILPIVLLGLENGLLFGVAALLINWIQAMPLAAQPCSNADALEHSQH